MMQYQCFTHMRSSLKYSRLYKTFIGLLFYRGRRAIINDLTDVAYTASYTRGVRMISITRHKQQAAERAHVVFIKNKKKKNEKNERKKHVIM